MHKIRIGNYDPEEDQIEVRVGAGGLSKETGNLLDKTVQIYLTLSEKKLATDGF